MFLMQIMIDGKYTTAYLQMIALLATIGLALLIRFLVPAIIKAETSGKQFGLGVLLFVIYTVFTIAIMSHFTSEASSVEDCTLRAVLGVVITNIMVLFAACIFFFTREKRPLSQTDKMKLKDL